jgi:hypothetical protein
MESLITEEDNHKTLSRSAYEITMVYYVRGLAINMENYYLWILQSKGPARHWIQAIKIIIFIWGHHSSCSICLEERKQEIEELI